MSFGWGIIIFITNVLNLQMTLHFIYNVANIFDIKSSKFSALQDIRSLRYCCRNILKLRQCHWLILSNSAPTFSNQTDSNFRLPWWVASYSLGKFSVKRAPQNSIAMCLYSKHEINSCKQATPSPQRMLRTLASC